MECKKLLRNLADQFMVPVQFGTNCASVSDYSEALFVEWLRRYISDVVSATEDEVLSSLSDVFVTFSAPDHSASGARPSSDATDREFHCFEWLVLTECARFVTCRDYSLVPKSKLSRLLPSLPRMKDLSGDLRSTLYRFTVASSCVQVLGLAPGHAFTPVLTTRRLSTAMEG